MVTIKILRPRKPTPIFGVWGQKDLTNGRAHLWIANANHTWKNVVDNTAISAIGDTITISGFAANHTFTATNYNTYSGTTTPTTLTSDSSGQVKLVVSSLTTDYAVKLADQNIVVPTNTPTLTPTNTPIPTSTIVPSRP